MMSKNDSKDYVVLVTQLVYMEEDVKELTKEVKRLGNRINRVGGKIVKMIIEDERKRIGFKLNKE